MGLGTAFLGLAKIVREETKSLEIEGVIRFLKYTGVGSLILGGIGSLVYGLNNYLRRD